MNSFSAVIDAFQGRFAEAIGIPESHARTMKARDSIPSKRWMETVEAARRLEIPGITLELLAQLELAKTKKEPHACEAAQ